MEIQCFKHKRLSEKSYWQRLLHFALGILAVLFLWNPGSVIAEENMCTDLKKINNLDELLYQMYINLDSDCLFTMPLAELEEAWGIKILSEEHLKPGQTLSAYPALRNSADFAGKPYRSELDAFYVEALDRDHRRTDFWVHMTKAYGEAHLTHFPEGNFPRLLPEPVDRAWVGMGNVEVAPMGVPASRLFPKNPGRYEWEHTYYWFNADRTRAIMISPSQYRSVDLIIVTNHIPE